MIEYHDLRIPWNIASIEGFLRLVEDIIRQYCEPLRRIYQRAVLVAGTDRSIRYAAVQFGMRNYIVFLAMRVATIGEPVNTLSLSTRERSDSGNLEAVAVHKE